MYFFSDEHRVLIYTDMNILDDIPFLKNIELGQESPHLYFVKEQPDHHPWENVCIVKDTIGELYKYFDVGAFYGLLASASHEHIHNMISCMLLDQERTAFIKATKQKIKEQQPLDLPIQFSIRRFDECFDGAQIIDYASPSHHEKDIITGVHELLLNGIEHGNLGLSTEEKIHLYQNGNIFHSLMKRLNKQENLLKNVQITCSLEQHEEKSVYKVTIKDCGKGFISKNIPLEEKTRLHGRGTSIAKQLSFDEITYNNDMNAVEAIIFLNTIKK